MKKPELYQKTVDILVAAYFNNTLVHGKCSACAVGNICAASTGTVVIMKNGFLQWENGQPYWGTVFSTEGRRQTIDMDMYFGKSKDQIDATGYTLDELAKIEYAFETAARDKNKDERMFNGLMAVIDALDIIHENNDAALTQTSKQRFNKELQCQ